jgi:PPP family 3-phenylpropionic acid transporter
MAFSPPLWVLWPLQTLHAFTFAAAYLAGLELIRKQAPKGYETLAQTLSAAYSSGFMTGLGTLASGVIYDAMGGRGYGVMAALCLIGLGTALYLWRQSRLSA